MVDIVSKMTKKYMIDLLCITFSAVSIPMLMVGKPEINYDKKIRKIELSQTERQKDIDVNSVHYEREYGNIEDRNIFSPDGLYKLPELKGKLYNKGKLNDKIYRFIGVLESGQKKAVFIKYTGDIVILKIGDKLEDNSVITGIDNLSVRLKKGSKEIEHKIFNLEDKSNAD